MINSFFRNLWDFGPLRIVRSIDFMLAVLISILSAFLSKYHGVKFCIDFDSILSILTSLFAFVFAALAIVISLSDEKLLKLLGQLEKLGKLLFHYWYSCIIYLLSILIIFAFKTLNLNDLSFIALFFFLYSLFLTFGLVKTTISFGFYRSKMINTTAKTNSK